jgi:hypothetical protein
MSRGVRVSVENADALERATDVLALKYAQVLYGVDHAAMQRVGAVQRIQLPNVGDHTVVRQPPGVRARTLLMIGTPSIDQFGYREIREFGKRALSVAAAERLHARELCLTLHGVGFGLDETEALQAELAGVLDALQAGLAEPTLEAVKILERDADRAERMKAVLDDIRSPAAARRTDPSDMSPSAIGTLQETLESAGRDTATRPHAFIAMPFHTAYEDRFHYGIAKPLRRLGMICERMDQVNFTGDVVAMMRRRIESANLVVADLSSANPNVYLEIGYAWACRRPTILLCDSTSEPLFDVRGQRLLYYESIRELEDKLTKEVSVLLRLP